jgi:hypothetical protein
VVEQGGLLTLRFDRPIRPTSISVSRRESSTSPPLERFDVAADNPTQFRANFPVGTHIITMFTTWPQGDATYVFEVTVTPFQPGLGVLSPEILDAITRLTEAARHVADGDGLLAPRIAALVASTESLAATVQEMVDALVGGLAGLVDPALAAAASSG